MAKKYKEEYRYKKYKDIDALLFDYPIEVEEVKRGNWWSRFVSYFFETNDPSKDYKTKNIENKYMYINSCISFLRLNQKDELKEKLLNRHSPFIKKNEVDDFIGYLEDNEKAFKEQADEKIETSKKIKNHLRPFYIGDNDYWFLLRQQKSISPNPPYSTISIFLGDDVLAEDIKIINNNQDKGLLAEVVAGEFFCLVDRDEFRSFLNNIEEIDPSNIIKNDDILLIPVVVVDSSNIVITDPTKIPMDTFSFSIGDKANNKFFIEFGFSPFDHQATNLVNLFSSIAKVYLSFSVGMHWDDDKEFGNMSEVEISVNWLFFLKAMRFLKGSSSIIKALKAIGNSSDKIEEKLNMILAAIDVYTGNEVDFKTYKSLSKSKTPLDNISLNKKVDDVNGKSYPNKNILRSIVSFDLGFTAQMTYFKLEPKDKLIDSQENKDTEKLGN